MNERPQWNAPKSNAPPAPAPSIGDVLLFLLAALLFFFVGLGTLASSLQDLVWRQKLRTTWQEGRCRVLSSKVISVGSSFEVEIIHQLELEGRNGRPTRNTETEIPTAPTQDEAEAIARRYKVGELYPCWYEPARPDDNNVLLLNGLEPWESARRIALSLLLCAPSLAWCLWRVRRWRAAGCFR